MMIWRCAPCASSGGVTSCSAAPMPSARVIAVAEPPTPNTAHMSRSQPSSAEPSPRPVAAALRDAVAAATWPRAKSRAEELADRLESVERNAEVAEGEAHAMLKGVMLEHAEAELLPEGDVYKAHLLQQARFSQKKADAKRIEATALMEAQTTAASPRA